MHNQGPHGDSSDKSKQPQGNPQDDSATNPSTEKRGDDKQDRSGGRGDRRGQPAPIDPS